MMLQLVIHKKLLMFTYVALSDLMLMDFVSVIPPGASESCFQLLAVDDEIIEETEVFMVIVETVNPNDVINKTILVVVTDNDGIVNLTALKSV